MDRNFPGFALIKEIREQRAHLLMRIKSDIVLPLVEALPDGSYASFLSDGACCIPVRVVEYDVKVPGRDGAGDELYALAATLTDWQAYPAAELAACYPGPVGRDRNRHRRGQVRDHRRRALPRPDPALVVPAPGHPGDVGLDHRHPAGPHSGLPAIRHAAAPLTAAPGSAPKRLPLPPGCRSRPPAARPSAR